jgi:uncharacterized protein YdhG (YjbR/CyaY superfamily)
MKIVMPKDYFSKFDSSVQRQAANLIELLLQKFPELHAIVKYNTPFFQLKSDGWSVFGLMYQKQQFKIGFVNDAALAFFETKRHERLNGSKDYQAFLFDPTKQEDMQLAQTLIGEAIAVQLARR